jgi:hypothetical protein
MKQAMLRHIVSWFKSVIVKPSVSFAYKRKYSLSHHGGSSHTISQPYSKMIILKYELFPSVSTFYIASTTFVSWWRFVVD